MQEFMQVGGIFLGAVGDGFRQFVLVDHPACRRIHGRAGCQGKRAEYCVNEARRILHTQDFGQVQAAIAQPIPHDIIDHPRTIAEGHQLLKTFANLILEVRARAVACVKQAISHQVAPDPRCIVPRQFGIAGF